MDWNDYCFRKVLPLLFAFAGGVVTMDVANEWRESEQVSRYRARAADADNQAELARHIAHHAVNRGAQCLRELEARIADARPTVTTNSH
jgi:hypothetical protein